MVSALIRAIMDAKGMQQSEFADALGIPLDRVKNLATNRVKKLTPEETRALVEKMGVRAHYLATGELPIFQSPGDQELQRRMASLKQTSDAASALELPRAEGEFVRDVLYGVAIKSPQLIRETIENYVATRQAKTPRKKETK